MCSHILRWFSSICTNGMFVSQSVSQYIFIIISKMTKTFAFLAIWLCFNYRYRRPAMLRYSIHAHHFRICDKYALVKSFVHNSKSLSQLSRRHVCLFVYLFNSSRFLFYTPIRRRRCRSIPYQCEYHSLKTQFQLPFQFSLVWFGSVRFGLVCCAICSQYFYFLHAMPFGWSKALSNELFVLSPKSSLCLPYVCDLKMLEGGFSERNKFGGHVCVYVCEFHFVQIDLNTSTRNRYAKGKQNRC